LTESFAVSSNVFTIVFELGQSAVHDKFFGYVLSHELWFFLELGHDVIIAIVVWRILIGMCN
jgi:hypothetical protein